MSHIDTALEPSRFNKVGTSGNRGSDSNIVDSYNQTFEFEVAAQTGSLTFDTGIVLPAHVQAMSGMLIVDVAEATGLVKSLTVGIAGSTDAIMNTTPTIVAATIGQPILIAFDNPPGGTLLITFGSDDWVEFAGRFIIECKCVR